MAHNILVLMLLFIIATVAINTVADYIIWRGELELGPYKCVELNPIVFSLEVRDSCGSQDLLTVKIPYDGRLVLVASGGQEKVIQTARDYYVQVAVSAGVYKVYYYVSDPSVIVDRNIRMIENLGSVAGFMDTVNMLLHGLFTPVLTLTFIAVVAARTRNPTYIMGSVFILSASLYALLGLRAAPSIVILIAVAFAVAVYNIFWRRSVL